MRLTTSLPLPLLLFLHPIFSSASPLTATTNQSSEPTPTATLRASPAPLSPSHRHPTATVLPALELREIVNNPAAAQPAAANPTQVSPVTTLMLWQTVAPGAPAQQVQVVYSQVFEPVPDQWEAPQPGTVGMGTIKGTVGVVKTNNKVRRVAVAVATAIPGVDELEARSPVEFETRDAAPEAEAEPEPDAFVILPPGNGAVQQLEKRKKVGKSSTGAAGRVALNAGPPTLALLIAVVAAMVM